MHSLLVYNFDFHFNVDVGGDVVVDADAEVKFTHLKLELGFIFIGPKSNNCLAVSVSFFSF